VHPAAAPTVAASNIPCSSLAHIGLDHLIYLFLLLNVTIDTDDNDNDIDNDNNDNLFIE
jgi:hypothetical protein